MQPIDLRQDLLSLSERHDALPQSVARALPAIDWADKQAYRPQEVVTPETADNAPLPEADVVLMTWTLAEWAALDHVFFGYAEPMTPDQVHAAAWREPWRYYRRDYCSIHQYMAGVKSTGQGGAPSLNSAAWGSYRLVSLNGLRVLLFKSGMHLAQDGSQLPLTQLVEQICKEVSPKLFLSAGTAGGVRNQDALGSALITNQAYFHLLSVFKSAPFNGSTVRSDWLPDDRYLSFAQQRTVQVSGYPVYPVSPQYPADAVIEPDAADSRLKLVTDQPIITTDTFLFGTTDNGLEQYGCIVEMDDAVIGMVCEQQGVAFGFVRNVSDPVINAQMPWRIQQSWAGYIYQEQGLFTSFNGALACWALVAAESDRKAEGD